MTSVENKNLKFIEEENLDKLNRNFFTEKPGKRHEPSSRIDGALATISVQN